MPEASAGPAPEVTYAIDYHTFAGGMQNPDFKGKGRLVIRPDGPTYVFSGQAQKLFAKQDAQLVLGPDDIHNVLIDGRLIQFTTRQGKAGKNKQPFSFYCRDEAEAQTVASLLPRHLDQEFIETRGFAEKLQAVTEAGSPWTSVTNILIALNFAVFIVMGTLGAGWFETASIMPYVLYGANNGAATTDGEWWRLVTSMFMHYGLLHLLLNMWALYQAGHFLEKLQGRALYALTYLGSGLAGGFASIAWHGDKSWSAGASGAVFGVYGAILGYMLREKKALPEGVYKSMMRSSLTFAGYNIIYGMARSGIDNAAHLGGVAGGLVLGWLLALPLDREIRARQTGRHLQLGAGVLGLLVVAGVALTPRFNYNVKDVLAWEETNDRFQKQEDALLQKNEEALSLKNGRPDATYAAWVEDNLVPFYTRWHEALTALSLTPGKSTLRMRDAMVRVFELRISSYHHFADGIRTQDPQAVSRFNEENQKVMQEIQKLQELTKQP